MTEPLYDDYRDAIRRKLRVLGLTPNEASVSTWAHVQPMADGAFIEVTLWVPRADLERIKEAEPDKQ